jgi:hypothetical protein
VNRIERDGAVLYFERHWKTSLLFFALGAAVLAAPLYLTSIRPRECPLRDATVRTASFAARGEFSFGSRMNSSGSTFQADRASSFRGTSRIG